jgi:protein CWC15
MTTAHRPTFDPARGKEAARGVAYHTRLLPAHTALKFRQAGQGGDADHEVRDLRAELLKAEAAHFAKKNGKTIEAEEDAPSAAPKRTIEDAALDEADEEEDPEAKRRRLILEEARDLDADSDGSSEDSSDEEDDEEDETAELMRELEKIKRERAEQRAQEVNHFPLRRMRSNNANTVQEAEKAKQEEDEREFNIARGNPLLNPKDFNIKRRWDDDVVFKNQARGTEDKRPKEFVNDLLRSDFHKRFMSRYVR